MSQMPSLEGAAVDLGKLREQAIKGLIEVLESVSGKKTLILDSRISGPLALIAQTSLLKEHGVENLYHLSDELQIDSEQIVFLVRPSSVLMVKIANQIRSDVKRNIFRHYFVFFAPRRTVVCEKVLEDQGVYADVKIGEYPFDIIPFDDDVLSLELEMSYKECNSDGDFSSLYYTARSIMKLQELYGVIPHLQGKGRHAMSVAEMLPKIRSEQPLDFCMPPTSEIHSCILLDRQVDLVTPLCTQLTYEGLLDEFLHISNGTVEVDPAVMGQEKEKGARKVKLALNSSDKLYQELRDVNFGAIGPLLKEKATIMKQDYAEVTGQKQSVSELKDFVKKLNSLPELTKHTNLAQHLSTFSRNPSFLKQLGVEQSLVEGKSFDSSLEYLEELVYKQEPLGKVLRLVCLISVVFGGLPKKSFDHIRREILHSYGFEHMFTLSNLEKAGILKKQENRLNWQTIKRGLRLVVDDVDDARPNDIAYTFSGYAPISARLVQLALSKGGWKSAEESMKLLPGPQFEKQQSKNGAKFVAESSGIQLTAGKKPLVLVVFIGGVTFAEISALRFLSSQVEVNANFLVLTTKLINGNSLMQTLVEDPSKVNQ